MIRKYVVLHDTIGACGPTPSKDRGAVISSNEYPEGAIKHLLACGAIREADLHEYKFPHIKDPGMVSAGKVTRSLEAHAANLEKENRQLISRLNELENEMVLIRSGSQEAAPQAMLPDMNKIEQLMIEKDSTITLLSRRVAELTELLQEEGITVPGTEPQPAQEAQEGTTPPEDGSSDELPPAQTDEGEEEPEEKPKKRKK